MSSRNEVCVDGDTARVLTTNGSFVIDTADIDLIKSYRWCISCGYVSANVKGKSVRLHVFLMKPKRGRLVDHRDGDGLNNRRGNLRVTTKSGNGANKIHLNSNNRSGYHGVHKHTQNGRWVAQIKVKGKRYHIGLFDSPEEAARAYNKRAREEFGEFATKLNEGFE